MTMGLGNTLDHHNVDLGYNNRVIKRTGLFTINACESQNKSLKRTLVPIPV